MGNLVNLAHTLKSNVPGQMIHGSVLKVPAKLSLDVQSKRADSVQHRSRRPEESELDIIYKSFRPGLGE